jgi:hypothetical protein
MELEMIRRLLIILLIVSPLLSAADKATERDSFVP